MNVTVFGGSSPKPGSQAYQQAYTLGENLARAGHSVLTGGYIGTMEAVSRGAAEANGHVIGVTCSQIENWRPVKVNAWVHEERNFISLQDRLFELITNCDVALALPGGPGTLTEISLTWNLMIINAIPKKPLILIGKEWLLVMNSFYQALSDYCHPDQNNLLLFANDIKAAYSMLET
ncbi:MAG: LOG family protein [Chloroflexota bacterium]